jgi:TolA-binding protein
VQKNTGKAIAYYNKAIGMNGQETDYALFQVAMCYGLQGKSRSKISKLNSLISSYPNSEFVVDAKYEIGETYFFSDKPDDAVAWFDKVVDEHPQSQYAGRSILNKALVFYNRNEDEVALPLFKQVANDYPGTSEASEALGKIQKIYVEGGNVRQFEDYLSQNSFPDATKGSLDTSYYEAAQLMYQRGEMVSAMQEFEKYLQKFPNGYFALDAHYFKAEIALDLKKYDQALRDFNQVLEYAKTSYTERALVAAAQIHMYQKEYAQAQLKYAMLEEIAERSENKMEARIGLMRTHFKMDDFGMADKYAEKVLRSDRVERTLKDEANLISAKCALGMDNLDIALAKFQQVVNQAQNVAGAEAKYAIAEIHHNRDDYEKSQETIFELVNQFANYENWVGKSFLLLAENYVKQEDFFQAKLTLQNVIENYDGEIQKKAQAELKRVEKFEAFSNAD